MMFRLSRQVFLVQHVTCGLSMCGLFSLSSVRINGQPDWSSDLNLIDAAARILMQCKNSNAVVGRFIMNEDYKMNWSICAWYLYARASLLHSILTCHVQNGLMANHNMELQRTEFAGATGLWIAFQGSSLMSCLSWRGAHQRCLGQTSWSKVRIPIQNSRVRIQSVSTAKTGALSSYRWRLLQVHIVAIALADSDIMNTIHNEYEHHWKWLAFHLRQKICFQQFVSDSLMKMSWCLVFSLNLPHLCL